MIETTPPRTVGRIIETDGWVVDPMIEATPPRTVGRIIEIHPSGGIGWRYGLHMGNNSGFSIG